MVDGVAITMLQFIHCYFTRLFVLYNTNMKPTNETYQELQYAFDKFNALLFDGQLPSCLLTLQREKASVGYFSSNRFANQSGQFAHEIAMNPSYFAIVPLIEVMQTLAHEMVHLWQFCFGQAARGRYHNAQWADKMESIGLMPSSTGAPGGARTGDRMADYAISGGRFLQACSELLTGQFKISWYDRFPPERAVQSAAYVYSFTHGSTFEGVPQDAVQLPAIVAGERARLEIKPGQAALNSICHVKKPTRQKYQCTCENAVWGKPNLLIRCEECQDVFVLAE
jgi:predicted SprT family Zn-dependent metalloprotease